MKRTSNVLVLGTVLTVLAVIAVVPLHSTISTTGEVIPAGLGPGDTTITSNFLVVGDTIAGTLAIDGGTVLTIDSDGAIIVSPNFNVLADGEINISDAGVLRVLGNNTFMGVGFSFMTPGSIAAAGRLNINTGGALDGVQFLAVGSGPNGNGTVTLDGATSTIHLKGICTLAPCSGTIAGVGAFLTIGSVGTGEVNITNGAKFIIDPFDPSNPGATPTMASDGSPLLATGLVMGGDSVVGFGGDGTLNIDGAGSQLTVKGNLGGFAAGQANGGTGTINITNGGKLVMENLDGMARGVLGNVVDSGEGTINVSGSGSLLDAGSFLGVGTDPILLDLGNGIITLGVGGTVKADEIAVGFGGIIKGTGTLMGTVILRRGVIDPGFSIGEISVNGNVFFEEGSSLLIEADGATAVDRLIASGDVTFTGGTIVLSFGNGFAPSANQTVDFLDAASIIGLSAGQVQIEGLMEGFIFILGGDGDITAQNDGVPSSVEPIIDVRPGELNDIDPGSNQLFPVAILTTQDLPIFDATQVDPATVRFGPTAASPNLKKIKFKDVDDDGDLDLRLWFRIQDTGIVCGDGSAELTGQTFAGTVISATETINTVNCP